jgi:dipeptidyl aminopeptidase/acylaminoacyl peptidase
MFEQKRGWLLVAAGLILVLGAGWRWPGQGLWNQGKHHTRPAALTPTPQPSQSSDELSYTPSPDGQWTAIINQTNGALDLQQPDGEMVSIFPAGSTVQNVTWSPDSRHLVAVQSHWVFDQPAGSGVSSSDPIEIWHIKLEQDQATTPVRVFQSENSEGEWAEQIIFGHWSPDSRRLLFWHGLLSASILADGLPLSVLDVSTGEASQLAEITLLNPHYQSWAPDGSALIFTAGGYRSAQVGKWLALYETSSGQVTTVISETEQIPGVVAWSPQGDLIAYAAVPAEETGEEWADLMTFDNPAIAGRRIYLFSPATGETRRLNETEAFQDGPVWSDDGRTLYYAERRNEQLQLMAAEVATGKAEPVVGAVIPLPEFVGYYGQWDQDTLLAQRPGGELAAEPGAEAQATPIVTPTQASEADLELVRFIFEQHPPEVGTLTEDFLKQVEQGDYTDFSVQEVDLGDDSQPELLVSGRADVFHLFVAILRQPDSGQPQELFYTASNAGKYLGEVRAMVDEEGRVIADFLTATGGTGYLETTWEQRWIECGAATCTEVWAGPLLQASRSANWLIERQYAVSELEQTTPETIQVTTSRFGVTVPLLLTEDAPPPEAQRTQGPDSVIVYQRDGRVYQPASRSQVAPGQVIGREFDLQTQETNNLVHEVISQPLFAADTFDQEAYDTMLAELWDLPPAGQPEDLTWGSGSRQADIAAHTGPPGELGEWVAGVVGSLDGTECRLVVLRQTSGDLRVIGRADLPCTLSFTHLAWADVTGDGRPEALLTTIPPGEEASGRIERLHVFSPEASRLAELATLDGVINGPDGAGIRWQETEDGFRVEAGLPLIDLDALTGFEEIRLERDFEGYVWDAESESFEVEE